MFVSLKILPLVVRPDGIQLRLSVGEAQGTWTYVYDDLIEAGLAQKPITIRLEEPQAPIPSAKRIKKLTAKQEERVASDMGGHRQKGSGAVRWRKGDGRVKGLYRIENKMRFTKGITITREDLNKIRGECSIGEVPLFQVDFACRSTGRVEDSWIVVPYEHWKKVIGETSDD